MYRYGFELEGFVFKEVNGELVPTVPPKGYPTDGFPGLVELRTRGDNSLTDAYWEILNQYIKYTELINKSFWTYEVTFTPEQKRQIRKMPGYHKPQADIQNIYGKRPRALGNKTIASCQINISNKTSEEYKYIKDGHICTQPAKFGLLDVGRIVRALDKEFEKEIRSKNRQLGEYCIKGDRLEYRSLPNVSFEFSLGGAKRFLDRIKNCVED